VEARLTQRKNSVKIKLIRHSNPGFQLYPLQSTKSSPQIFGDEFQGNWFNNLNFLNISLLNYKILNKKEEGQKKYGGIDQAQKPTNFNMRTAFILRCINKHELKCPGGGFPIRVYTLSFNAKGNMVQVEIYRVVSFKAYTRMGPAARGLLCFLKSEVSEVGWNYGGWRNGCMNAWMHGGKVKDEKTEDG
jgi:hypothetical protein